MQRKHIIAALFIAVSFLPLFAVSQTYSFKHYSSADGLELSSINTIFQDSKGSLWFGGVGGAFRYDGNRFIPYLTKGANRSGVTRFAEGKDGAIWIATAEHGVAKVRYGENDSIEWVSTRNSEMPNDTVFALLSGGDGTMYIGTKRGVFILWNDGTSSSLTKDSGLHSDWVRMMVQDHSGGIWIGTNGGVTRYVVEKNRIVSWKKIQDGTTLSLIVKRDGTVVIGTVEGGEKNKGVFGYRNDSLFTIVAGKEYTDPLKIQALLEDSRGSLWIGTYKGIILKNPAGERRIRTAHGLANETIGCILEDRDGSIWIATGNGAMKLPVRYTMNYTELQGLSGILTVYADRSNTIWCGGFSPLYKIGTDDKVHDMSSHPLLKDQAIFSIVQDLRGNVWFATLYGLLMYDGKNFSRQYLGDHPSTLYVSALAPDNNGGVWVGLKGEILNIDNRKIVSSYSGHDSIPDTDISALRVDRKGRVWFGTYLGGGMIDNGAVTMIGAKDGLPDDDIERIKEDSHGRIWIVTGSGVAYVKEGVVHRLTAAEFPFDDVRVTDLHEDASGHIWFGTMSGIIEWSDSVLSRYDTRDGLSGDIISAIAEDTFGNLWLGTGGGLTKFPHSERLSFVPKPTVHIERISDEAERNIISSQTTIPYDERTVTFQASSLSFYDERNMEFQYMLNGIDQKWNPVTKQRIIRYTTLPSGDYTLRVRARNRNGEWTEPAAYSFGVLPPFWKTWWFMTGVVIFCSAAVFLSIRQRIRRLQREKDSQEQFSKQLMEVYETERGRIASELHDGLGQNLLIIANRAKMGLKKDEVALMQKDFEIISSNALESISDVRKITYNLHPLQIDEVGMTTALESMLKRMSSLIDNTLTFTVEQIDGLLQREQRIHFFRVIQETLSNAVKHSSAGQIEVNVMRDGDSIRAIIKDNGKGFDPNDKKEGYGMRSINERVKILGGRYAIESSPGAGTVIKINIPIGKGL